MSEEFLYYVWQYKLFDPQNIFLDGEPFQLLKPGRKNLHDGPDFFDARVRIGKTTWAGNVEIHVKTSDWYKHNHQQNKSYQNVIAHVVFEDDLDADGNDLPPVIELKERISTNLINKYNAFLKGKKWIPCQDSVGEVPEEIINIWLERLLVERLERKTNEFNNLIAECNNDLEQAFYIALARGFGLKNNVQPFEMLARSLPLKILLKHADQLHQVEALLFGQAGLLEAAADDQYTKQLKEEYKFLRHKYGLTPLGASIWKFGGQRPSNFPTLRIAQLARFICDHMPVLGTVEKAGSVKALEKLLDKEASPYWETHYVFGKKSSRKSAKKPGQSKIHVLLINTFLPFTYAIGMNKDLDRLKSKALQFYNELPPEKNSIIKKWVNLNFNCNNAFHSQALIQLKTGYCDRKNCLNCMIGSYLLKP